MMRPKNLKKSVTPIIAVIMLLLITLSLAGMAMMIFTQLGKSSQAQIAARLKEYNIRADISNAIAEPNSNDFSFKLKNYAKIKLPIDGKNTKIVLNANGIPIECKFNTSLPSSGGSSSGSGSGRKCVCVLYKEDSLGSPVEDYKTGLYPGVGYMANCTQTLGPFSIVKNYMVEWYYMGEGGEKLLDSETIEVGAIK